MKAFVVIEFSFNWCCPFAAWSGLC